MNKVCPHCGYDDYEVISDEHEFVIRVCHACNETYEYNRTAEEIAEVEADIDTFERMTPDEVDAFLRGAGYDPEQIGKDGAAFAKQMSEKYN
jgi:phage gp29-like protein